MNCGIDELDARSILKEFLHCFCHDKKWYAFATWANRLWMLDSNEAKLILDFLQDTPISSFTVKEQNFIANLYKKCKPTDRIQKNHYDEKVESMILLVTEGCNFACTYCYGSYPEKHMVMDLHIAKKAVDLAVQLGVEELIFFGGEPLLNFPLIKEVVEYIKSIEYHGAIRITTNGSLITDQIARFFSEYNIEVSVSMDGSRKQHDTTRVYKDGKSSYDKVVEGINLLKKYNALSLIEITYSARHDVELTEQVCEALKLYPVVSCACVDGRKGCKHSKDVVSGERMKLFYEKVLDLSKQIDDKKTVLGIDELYAKICNGETLEFPRCLCSDILSRIIVFADGSISPCPEMTADKYQIGNVKDIRPAEFLKNRVAVLEKLSSKNLKKEWFSSLFETCIQHVVEQDGMFVYEDVEGFSDCAEALLVRYAKENS